MDRQNRRVNTTEKIKHWLLSRQHIRSSKPTDAATASPLPRLLLAILIGWGLTRAPLLFSVNPLPAAAAIASSRV